MNIETKRIIKNVCGADGKNYTVRLEIPFFSADMVRLNEFYEKLAEKLEENAIKNNCTIISELHKTFEDNNIFSVYIDLLWYRGKELLACHRICDTRRSDGYEIRPPKGIKKLSQKSGWYYTDADFIVYENRFDPDTAKVVRRSEYSKFFFETKYKIANKSLQE